MIVRFLLSGIFGIYRYIELFGILLWQGRVVLHKLGVTHHLFM